MNFDPDHLKFGALLIGVVRDSETGEIRWPVVIASLLTAGVIGAITMSIAMTSEVSAIRARQQIVFERLAQIEASTHPATAKRYTSDDAARDMDLIRSRIRESEERSRDDHSELNLKIQRMEDRMKR